MSEVFISYARSTAGKAQQIAEALRAHGYGVWRDDQLPAHRDYSDVIEERLRAAKAVVVVWSAEAVKSQWVRAEADLAREAGTLVQLRLDGASLPMPFNRIQCADLARWPGDLGTPAWKTVVDSIADLVRGGAHPAASAAPVQTARRVSICVLPFANMSGEAEQEYFSDGISEDVITDLSKVSALSVVARNTAFTFKGKSVDVPDLAARLKVSHVLEGSVRRAGGRVRITAQLVDGAAGDHVWAERYDRDLADIFALQDEISHAIVTALKLTLLPQEIQAIAKRGTTSTAAYDLYLLARKRNLIGKASDRAGMEETLRLCRAAVDIDPGYALAWAMMGGLQNSLRQMHGKLDLDPLAAIEKALALDPGLAEAHVAKAAYLSNEGRNDEALAEYGVALRLDPDSAMVHAAAGVHHYRKGDLKPAVEHYERAMALDAVILDPPSVLLSCYLAMGEPERARGAAAETLRRCEAALARDPGNTQVLDIGASALATLGRFEDAKAWARRALAVDPDDLLTQYNIACMFSVNLHDADATMEVLEPLLARIPARLLAHVRTDPDFDPIRDDARFVALLAKAEARIAAESAAAT